MKKLRTLVLAPAVLGTGAALALAPAAHADRPVGQEVAVVMTSGDVSPFTSVLPGCESGTVTDLRPHVEFLPIHGLFDGSKVFTCGDGGGGFVVQVHAIFGEHGSSGSWAVTGSWGTQAGLHDSGTLVGVPFDGGIADHYLG
jgi:hypothetical protein